MRRRLVLAALLLPLVSSVLALAPSSGSAGVIAFDDRAAWEAAAGEPILTESFDSLDPTRLDPGVGGTMSTPLFDIVLPPGMIEGAFIGDGLNGNGTRAFRGSLHGGDAQVDEFNEFRFATPIRAFSLDVGFVEDGFPGIRVSIAGGEFRLTDAGSFFGVVSDTPFTSVFFRDGGAAPRIYDIDNVGIAPIPEPGASAVLAVGALILLSCRARLARSSAGSCGCSAGTSGSRRAASAP